MKKSILIAGTIPFFVLGMAGCKKTVAAGGESIVQVKFYKGGYGQDFLDAIIERFESKNPDIKIDIVASDSMVTEKASQEIKDTKNNQIDLYFVTGTDRTNLINSSKSILRTSEKTLLEPLNDIYEKPAVSSDGKEETKTIKERLLSGFEEQLVYNGYLSKWQGNLYALPWASATTGLMFNTKVLEKYNLDTPLTSDQLINLCKEIVKHSAEDGIYPYTYAGTNAPGYWVYLYSTWFAQYSGKVAFDNFIKCDPASVLPEFAGDIKEHGYEVYNDDGYKKALEAMFDLMDINYSAPQTTEKDHMTAQNALVNGQAAFMVDGDWMANEMKLNYKEKIENDIIMAKTPILSSIGPEIGLENDNQLAAVVKAIDEGKSNAEVASLYAALNETGVQRVRDARTVVNSIGSNHEIIIPSYSDAKDAAKKFLRFFYSEEACHLYRNNSYANPPVSYEPADDDVKTPFALSCDAITNGKDKAKIINEKAEFNDVRSTALLYLFNNPQWAYPATFKTIIMTKYKDSSFTAQKIYEKEYEEIKRNWDTYMSYVTF